MFPCQTITLMNNETTPLPTNVVAATVWYKGKQVTAILLFHSERRHVIDRHSVARFYTVCSMQACCTSDILHYKYKRQRALMGGQSNRTQSTDVRL